MSAPTNEEYEFYTNLAFKRRGVVINETILLERIMDNFIVEHFCSDLKKRNELMELIIGTNRMIFENKVQVLKEIIERNYPEKKDEFLPICKKVLDTIIPERNMLAHFWLVTSEELGELGRNKVTQLVKFKNSTEYINYTQERFEGTMSLINECIRYFMNFKTK